MHPTWTEQWWPISYLQDLDPKRPSRFTLLDRDLVIWWDATGDRWRVFPDVCPHRLVPLSEGRINDAGQLECPYHGWSFDGSGQCQNVPQALGNTQPNNRRSRCASLPTASGQGLLFVWMGAPDAADPGQLPLVPALDDDPASWTVQDTFRDLPMDAVTLLENVLDVSHVPFTHHKTVGKRENASPVEATITDEDASGFRAYWEEGPRRGKLGAQSTRFHAPQLMWHDLTAKGFGRILTVVYAVPIRRGECRLFARFPFQFQSALPRVLIGLRPAGCSTSATTRCWKTIRCSCTGRSGCWSNPAEALLPPVHSSCPQPLISMWRRCTAGSMPTAESHLPGNRYPPGKTFPC